MADYAITGKKGAGKSLFAIGVIADAIRSGKRVATNLDVRLEHLLPATSKASIIRLPDRPTAADMQALGRGQPGVVEEDNGIIVLDETSTFFNSRNFTDKNRQPLLDWLVHSRKYGWDVYYICQGLAQIDKQIRETQIEYHIRVTRTDKWPVPFITPMLKMIGINLRLPKMHIGTIKHGVERDSMVVDRKIYMAKDLFPAYDTQQVFLDRDHSLACGLHSVLSPWHLKGRHLHRLYPAPVRFLRALVGRDPFPLQPDPPMSRKLKYGLAAVLFLAPVAAWAFSLLTKDEPKPQSPQQQPAPAPEKQEKSEAPKTEEDLFSDRWRLVGTFNGPSTPTINVLQAADGRLRYVPADGQNTGWQTLKLKNDTTATPFSGPSPVTATSKQDRKP